MRAAGVKVNPENTSELSQNKIWC